MAKLTDDQLEQKTAFLEAWRRLMKYAWGHTPQDVPVIAMEGKYGADI